MPELLQTTPTIPGLTYLPAYISQQEESSLLSLIDQQPWLNDLKRRVQHYGYKYQYKKLPINSQLNFLGELPAWVMPCVDKIQAKILVNERFNQIIVNEYQPGQGIAPHVDCKPCFTATVASLSLGSTCEIIFAHTISGAKAALILEPCSLLIMQDEARYDWKHSIPARQKDIFQGRILNRARRVSLTFRRVIV